MSYRLPAHLHRNRHGVLYFRLAVPADLRPMIGQGEIYRSLNTSSVRQAADAAQTLRIELRALFRELRSIAMSEEERTQPTVNLEHLRILMAERKRLLKKDDELDDAKAQIAALEKLLAGAKKQHARELGIAIQAKGGATTAATKRSGGKTVREAWEGYKAEKIAADAWKDGEDTAKYDHWPHVRTLIEVIGDKPLPDITADDINEFQSHVLADPDGGSPRNRDKRLTRAGAVLRWAKKKRLIGDDFAELFRYPGKIGANPYVAFDQDDLRALFESADYRDGAFKTPSEYWLPPLSLFTGARLNELCQLTASDIGTHDGIDTISILDEEIGKRLKNTSSRRIIPIHSALIALGFLRYVSTIKTGRIFPELPDDPHRPGNFGVKASELFTNYRRKCGVGAQEGRSKKAFHSFRSTLISALRKAGVPKDRRTRLAGHEYEDTQDKTYHGGDVLTMFDFTTLRADIEQVKFDVAFTGFKAT